jgi:hypothetical protein
MQKQFHYETCCVHSTAEKINAMTDSAREVTLATVRRHCADFADWCLQMGYERGGLTIGHDWAVSYYKSRYDGRPCYYVCHSAIEHIFTQEAA